MLLQEMRRVAEADLGQSVQKAVITVPAYFTEPQRQAVRDAGTIAGLQVLAIINEPTAAALSFGVRQERPLTVAVYDLGGGTFDISIVQSNGMGKVSVLATTGDTFLGGEDFDLRIVNWMIDEFRQEHGIDLGERPIAVQRLRIAAEKARVDLSSVEETKIRLPFIVTKGPSGPIDLVVALSRDTLHELSHDLVVRTISICEKALQAAKLKPSAIDEVLLVGGMTRTPFIRDAIRSLFGRDPSQRIHPDEAVALGAALHAAALSGESTTAQLDDVTAHPLGIMTAGGQMEVLIPSNSRLPAFRERSFTTQRDDQEAIRIIVLQGENTLASNNDLLGEFEVSGLPPLPAGHLEINVTFTIDEEGLFSAAAINLATGEQHAIDVVPDSGFDEGEVENLSAERSMREVRLDEAEEIEASRQRLDVLLSETARLVARVRKHVPTDTKIAGTLEKTDRLLALMHQALREGPPKDMGQEALVLQRTQQTLRTLLSKMAKR